MKQGLSAHVTPAGLQILPSPIIPRGQRPHLGPAADSRHSTPMNEIVVIKQKCIKKQINKKIRANVYYIYHRNLQDGYRAPL